MWAGVLRPWRVRKSLRSEVSPLPAPAMGWQRCKLGDDLVLTSMSRAGYALQRLALRFVIGLLIHLDHGAHGLEPAERVDDGPRDLRA